MEVLACQVSGQDNFEVPPFSVYNSMPMQPFSLDQADLSDLTTLPQSEIERHVNEYAEKVASTGQQHQKDFDLIHAHDWMAFPAAVKLQEKTHKPFVAHVHSTEFDRIPGGNVSHYISHTEYLGLQRADKVIAVSNFTKKVLVEKYFVDPTKIEVVHNGVMPLSTPPQLDRTFAAKRPVIVFMGRLTAQKGVEYFLDLAKAVVKEIPQALFVVAGNGDQYYSLLFRSADHQLSASVLFSGFVRDREREMLLDRADVFVMPSLSEPFGLVALEAAQRQTPVIVSNNSGVREVLHHALKVDFWDVKLMTQQIRRLLEDSTYRQEVITGQNQDLTQTSWQKSANKVRNIYQSLFKKGR